MAPIETPVRHYPDEAYSSFHVYRQMPPNVITHLPEKGAIFNEALGAYSRVPVEEEASGLFSDPNRVLNFFQGLQAANKLPDGDYAEVGTHKGFALRVIHKFMDPTRTLYSLDTFSGFDKRDLLIEAEHYDSPWVEGNFEPTSTERVANYVGDGTPPCNLELIEGWFPDTFKQIEGLRWRFVHIDLDLYQPIKSALECFWEPLLPGGVVMIHDYGAYGFPAARTAVDEFCASVGIWPIELTDRWSTAIIRKPT